MVVAALVAWKTYLSSSLQLHPDEAYYWLWSRDLAAGYFDHPPLIAYLIRLTTLASQQELWVRFGGILETLVVSSLTWALSIRLAGDEKKAAASVITANVLPLTLAGSIVITPDIPLFLFVSLGTYAYWRMVETGQARYWYLLGVAFGLALLSKYTAVLLAPSLLLFTIVTAELRWLRTIHPYAAFLLGCLLFLPVVQWNREHHWVSFAFQFQHGLGGNGYSLGKVMTFIGGQMLVAGPVIFLAGAYASVRVLFQKNREMLFLSLTSLTVLAFFAYSSLTRPAAPNWPCSAYFTLSILVSHYLVSGSKAKERLWLIGAVVSLTLSIAVGLHTRFGIIPLEKISHTLSEKDATNWFYGWKELARELEKDPEIKVAFTDTSQMAAEITYYSGERIIGYVDSRHFGGGQYEYWDLPEGLRGERGVCITYREGTIPCSEYFTSVGQERTFTVKRDGNPIRTYRFAVGEGCRCQSAR